MPTTNPDVEITGHVDPLGEVPWAMQIVIRCERDNLPTATTACEATALAVIRFLTDSRSDPDAPWYPAIERWLQGRIRKIVRRARGAAWERILPLPGVSYTHDNCEVRVFVPGPTDAVPEELSRLQVQGLQLEPSPTSAPEPDFPGAVLAVNPAAALADHTGKAAAQCAHAAQIMLMNAPPARRQSWAAAGYPVHVEWPDPLRYAALRQDAPVVVVDAGFTVVPEGTETVIAYWP